jgi:hypothetical protein
LSKLPFTPKLRRFGLVQNGVVLGILGFIIIIFFKKGRKLKKKGGEIGVAKPPHAGRMGVIRPPRKATKKKKKKKGKNGFGILGVVRGLGVASATLYVLFFFFFFGLSGWPNHPQRPGDGFSRPHTAGMGWPATP